MISRLVHHQIITSSHHHIITSILCFRSTKTIFSSTRVISLVTIAKKIDTFSASHPGADLIRLGIGDVTLPLSPAVIGALHAAVDDMAQKDTFRGYGPEQGYDFLRDTIAEVDFRQRGIAISADEIFIGDGSKSDTGNIGDILGDDNLVAITNPVYPVYMDTSIMRIGNSDKLFLLSCNKELLSFLKFRLSGWT